jgi:hypothetical protein
MSTRQVVTPQNLATDFRAIPGNKIVNDNFVGGTAATPTNPPTEPLKSWLYINTGTNRVTHYWSPVSATWVAFVDPVAPDFWRSGAGGTTLPDGTSDHADSISHLGPVAIGSNTNLGYTLDVTGAAAADLLVAKRGTAEGGEIWIESFTGSTWVFDQVPSPSPRLRIFNAGAPVANFLTVLESGLFGFGNASPTTKVHINSGTANDSGLRLEQLTSATPLTPGAAAIGVDATGKVVVVALPAAATVVGPNFPATANVTPTGIVAATASDYLTITIPSAGTWDIEWLVRGVATAGSGITSVLTTAANAVQANTEVLSIFSAVAANVQGNGSGKATVVTTAATTYKVRIFATGGLGGFAASDANGRSWIRARRIA